MSRMTSSTKPSIGASAILTINQPGNQTVDYIGIRGYDLIRRLTESPAVTDIQRNGL